MGHSNKDTWGSLKIINEGLRVTNPFKHLAERFASFLSLTLLKIKIKYIYCTALVVKPAKLPKQIMTCL